MVYIEIKLLLGFRLPYRVSVLESFVGAETRTEETNSTPNIFGAHWDRIASPGKPHVPGPLAAGTPYLSTLWESSPSFSVSHRICPCRDFLFCVLRFLLLAAFLFFPSSKLFAFSAWQIFGLTPWRPPSHDPLGHEVSIAPSQRHDPLVLTFQGTPS